MGFIVTQGPMRLILALSLMLTVPAPFARADDAHGFEDDDFRPVPLNSVVQRVTDRYDGRLIGVRLQFARPQEMQLGAQLVYEMRLLTP